MSVWRTVSRVAGIAKMADTGSLFAAFQHFSCCPFVRRRDRLGRAPLRGFAVIIVVCRGSRSVIDARNLAW